MLSSVTFSSALKRKKLNADGIILISNDMKCNESDMTGEKDDLDKKPYK